MSEQTTNRREFRPVEQLTGGEHINHQIDRDYAVLTYQVGHVAPYTDDNSVPMVALMLTPAGGGEPVLVRERRGVTVPIATESEVASAKATGNRFAVASALRQVADDIVNLRLPVPRYSFTVSGVLGSRDELERWAKHLDVEIRMSGDIPVIDKEVGGLTVHFQSAPEPAEPKPVAIAAADFAPVEPVEPVRRDWYFTFGSGQEHDGKYVVIAGTHDGARDRMLSIFGNRWSHQYAGPDRAGVEQFDLVELPESEWPTVATDAQPAGK